MSRVASTNRQLEHGREAFDRREWATAHAALTAVSVAEPLDAPDLWRLAHASYLVGREGEFLAALEAAHREYLRAGEALAAVRCAFWLGMHLANRGEGARASGWFGRAARLLEQEEADCAERGYLTLAAAHRHLATGDAESAGRSAGEAAACGQRFGDADLLALALHVHGRALLRVGRMDEGLALLDEAMVAVSADELSPPMTGIIYCSVIGACREVYALRRAREWIMALTGWCERQPQMVAYWGECRGYRAEILCRSGSLDQAIEEAQRAASAFADDARGPAGFAHYQRGEAHRIQGDLAAAEEAYAEASRCGYEPQPGLALLRLAQGHSGAAASAIARVLTETEPGPKRARLLPASIEINLERGSLDEAKRNLAELEDVAAACVGELLDAEIARARGAIELAAGNPTEALVSLREAWRAWRAADVPYEAARTRVLLARACRAVGDEDGASLELEAAARELDRLGADRALAELDRPNAGRAAGAAHGLTPREREVLALVATGRTNRAIARALFISEKTVARHLSNIFRKLGLSSRAAATAYAYEHGLLDSSG